MMKYKIGEVKSDEFGRTNGILIVNKPPGVTSHDVVDTVRKYYETKKVGHAGALDPFASGVLLILVGKATKMSNDLLNLNKTYTAKILLGVATDTQDVEGNVINIDFEYKLPSEKQINDIINSFSPSYNQFVPVFSSVKVNGEKLRVLARKYSSFKIVENSGVRKVEFFSENGELQKVITLPSKQVQILSIKLIKVDKVDVAKVVGDRMISESIAKELSKTNISTLNTLEIKVTCSKGTYIRQLSEDIGRKLNIPSMLINLRRDSISHYDLSKSIDLETLTK